MQRTGTADVLLTYCWVRSAYAALRNLSQHGLRVALGDRYAFGMCQQSRYGSGFHHYRSPFSDPLGFIDDINRILSRAKPALLLPSHDEGLVLARYRDKLPETVVLPLAPVDTLELVNDKARCTAFAASLRVPVPRSIHLVDAGGARQQDLGGPWVVKPCMSNSAKDVSYATSFDEAKADAQALARKRNTDKVLLQERVAGEGWGVSCLYWSGQRIAAFTHRRLREKILTGGTSTLRESASNPTIETYAFRLLDALQWHGLAMVEFKVDPRSGKCWFLEINPRMWGSIHLAITAGVEFPFLLYLAATRGADAACEYVAACPLKHPWRSRWYLGDCIGAIERFRRGRLRQAICAVLPGGADTFDDVHASDPMAFAGEVLNYTYRFLKARSLNPDEAAT